MNKPSIHTLNSSAKLQQATTQQGATLIAVLLVLLLVTSIAAIAMRTGNTDLKVATADQVEKLLFQSNDAAFLKVEKEDRLKANASQAKLKGFIVSDQVKEKETVSFCIRPRLPFLFNMRYISVTTDTGKQYNSYKDNGICDPSNEDDYANIKGRVITQMAFVKDAIYEADKEKFATKARGTESNDMEVVGSSTDGTCVKFTGYATSVLPSLTNASESAIKKCFAKGFSVPGDTTADCLDELGAAYETHKQVYQNVPTAYSCL